MYDTPVIPCYSPERNFTFVFKIMSSGACYVPVIWAARSARQQAHQQSFEREAAGNAGRRSDTFLGRALRCATALALATICGREPGPAAASVAALHLDPLFALEVAAALVGDSILSFTFMSGSVIDCAPALEKRRIVACVAGISRGQALLLIVDGVQGGLPRLLEPVVCQDV